MEAESPKTASTAELTVRAIVLGIVLSILLGAANAYLGLKVGMTVSASIPAAVVSMGILSVLGRHTALENNLVQTAASAGESLAAGVIFTIPALLMMGYWKEFDYLTVTMIAGLGGLLGVLFTIPLRRALIMGQELKFPEGVATAAVIEEGTKPGQKGGLKYIGLGALGGALFKLGSSGFGLFKGSAHVAGWVGKGAVAFGSELGPALLAVGYIVRLNIAALVFIGGAISWFIAIPLYTHMNPEVVAALDAANANDAAFSIWNAKIRYLGVGAMVVGGIWALVSMRQALVDGIRGGLAAIKQKKNRADLPREEQDLPMNWVLVGIGSSIVPIFLLYHSVTDSVGIGLSMAIVMVLAGFLFSAVAGYMAGLVGSSSNPISGITIATILFASLLLYAVMGSDAGMKGAASAIFIGAVVCCAAAIAGDNMQDLKAGHLLGSTPWKQQVMQIVGVLAAALVLAPVLMLLHEAYGFVGASTPEQTDPLTAPQAGLMSSVATGVFANNLPWNFIYAGAGIGAAVIAIDEWLRKSGASIRAPVLAVAVGIYLPLELATPILIGGLIAYFADKATKNHKGAGHKGLLVASGLITGEALVGIGLAIPIAISQDQSVLNLITEPWGSWPGILLLAGICLGLYRIATDTREEA